ncbi:histidine kinase [bacterium]|nr:histidine kinase [bacterium]
MHPILSDKKRLMLYLLVWIGLSSLVTMLIRFADESPWINAATFAAPLTMMFGFVNLSAYYICRAFPLGKLKFIYLIILLSGVAKLTTIIWIVIAQGWNIVLQSLDLAVPLHTAALMILYAVGMTFYLLSLAGHYLIITFEQAQKSERREFESQIFAREAELRMLRAQIDPHFIFNSLNSISALTTNDPAGARKMTLLLADFLRQSLKLAHERTIPLEEEWRLCFNFLEIEKIRFGTRLKVESRLDDKSGRCMVPPMLLQPLVENALKHGIGQTIDGGTIVIEAKRHDRQLHLSVENPVDDAPVAKKTGIGLANIQSRLKAMYGSDANFRSQTNDHKYRAEIILPAEENHG